MFWVYILKLSNGKYYIGQTNDLAKRIYRHQTGQCKFTKPFRPIELIFREEYKSRAGAMNRECYLKSLKSRVALEKLMNLSGGPIV